MIRLAAALPFVVVGTAAIAQYDGPAIETEVLLETERTVLDQPFAYPAGAAKITSMILTIQPGGETAWHSHAVPLLVHVLEGEVTVDYGDKGVKTYTAGETIVEAVEWPHKGMNRSDRPVRLFTVYAGAEGVANATPVDAPK